MQINPEVLSAAPTPNPTPTPAGSEGGSETGSEGKLSPTPIPTATPSNSGSSGKITVPGTLPDGVTALILGLSNRYLEHVGDTSQLLVRAVDKNGNEIAVKDLPPGYTPNFWTAENLGDGWL